MKKNVCTSFEFSPWIVFVCSVYATMIAGTNNMYSVYTQNLRSLLNYTTEETNLIGSMGNIGVWFGIFGGLFFDQYGVKWTGYLGGMMVVGGYVGISVVCFYVVPDSAWLNAIFMLLVGQGSAWVMVTGRIPSIKNFQPGDRGKILGSFACTFGLSPAIFTLFYSLFDSVESLPYFFLFLALFIGCLNIANTTVINITQKKYKGEVRKRFYFFYLTVSILAAVLVISSVVNRILDNATPILVTAIIVLLACFFFLILNTGKVVYKVEKIEVTIPAKKTHVLYIFKKLNMYLIYFIQFSLLGAAVMTVNNLSSIIISRSNLTTATTSDIPAFGNISSMMVSFSVSNALGSILFGFLSDKYVKKVNRAFWYIILAVIMLMSQIFFIFSPPALFYIGLILIGLSWGGCFAIGTSLVSLEFGAENFGGNWGIIATSNAIGSLLFSTFIAGRLSDTFEEKNRICLYTNNSNTCNYQCLGDECYLYTFIITSIMCFLGILCSIYLCSRIKK